MSSSFVKINEVNNTLNKFYTDEIPRQTLTIRDEAVKDILTNKKLGLPG